MKRRILSLVLLLAVSVGMAACGTKDTSAEPTAAPVQDAGTIGNTETPEVNTGNQQAEATPEPEKKPKYAAGTILRVTAEDTGAIWEEASGKLGINLETVVPGDAEETENVEKQTEKVDLLSGTVTGLSEAGVAGDVVNIAEYLEDMPNFKAYLKANSTVRFSITGDIGNGAIYIVPYPEKVYGMERLPFMRTDWIEKLLNGEGAYEAENSGTIPAAVYTPYMPTADTIAVTVVKADGSATETIKKDYDAAGNIIQIMNEALVLGDVTGAEAVNMLRDYIDQAYHGYYGTNRADLFIGQNAAWDADEFVALLRCVAANPQTLTGTETVQGIFCGEDIYQLAAVLFGVRGMESENDFLYVGEDGLLRDARQEAKTYEALEKMNAMVQEGLVAVQVGNPEDADAEVALEKKSCFMYYASCETPETQNETDTNDGENHRAVLIPVARWYDGTNTEGVYMRFTESRKSVGSQGFGISKESIGDDSDKLFAALALMDYAYSKEGGFPASDNPEVIFGAIRCGVIKYPEAGLTENPWYTSVATMFSNTADEAKMMEGFLELNSCGGEFLCDIVVDGYDGAGIAEMKDAVSAAKTVSETWGGSSYLIFKQLAWERLLTYYEKSLK